MQRVISKLVFPLHLEALILISNDRSLHPEGTQVIIPFHPHLRGQLNDEITQE